MKRTCSTVLLTVALAGCIPGRDLIADGRGRSCFRNQAGGRMFFGDVTYDGYLLHTEDGTFGVDAVAADELRLHTKFNKVQLKYVEDRAVLLRQVSEAPTVCREFFEKR